MPGLTSTLLNWMGDAVGVKAGLAFARVIRKKIKNYQSYQRHFADKAGIEIGGPSSFFSWKLPIYPVISSLDNVNFSTKTMWGDEQIEGCHFRYYGSRLGRRFIGDAVNLGFVESGCYDFILSCHSLEHVANPLKALTEWMRIIRQEGLILLVLPNKDSNFDHKRPITDFEHVLNDFAGDIPESDLTHLPEILALHDLSRDAGAGNVNQFRKRSIQNLRFRCLHHHVYDMALLREMTGYLRIETVLSHSSRTEHVLLGQKKGSFCGSD